MKCPNLLKIALLSLSNDRRIELKFIKSNKRRVPDKSIGGGKFFKIQLA